MTTDPSTTAARESAEQFLWALPDDHPAKPLHNDGFMQTHARVVSRLMAEWARTHLAAQEPTDAEVEALVDSLDWAIRGTTDGDRIDQDSELPVGEVVRLIHEGARAALSAARAVRNRGEA